MSKKRTPFLTKLRNYIVGATLGTPIAASAGWILYSNLFVSHTMPLPPAVSGERKTFQGRDGQLSYYVAGQSSAPPLLLIHSINAAASTYEMRPLFEHYRQTRRVYSLDMPGYGFSERSERDYTPRLFTSAIIDMLDVIEKDTGAKTVDAMALSLSGEFLCRAASEHTDRFRTLALVTPTAFRIGERRFYEVAGTHRGNPLLYKAFNSPLWSRPFFDLLCTRSIQMYFLKQLFSPYVAIDQGLVEYDYLTVHQPDAQYAPFTFVSGQLFSADIDRVYDAIKQPTWVAYGTYGRFSDVDPQKALARGENWYTRAFPTGSLPHFEQPDQFFAAYDEFLNRACQLLIN